VEVKTGIIVIGKRRPASPGSETMACLTEPWASLEAKRVCRTTEEGGRQMRFRESDSLIVPVKAGNAAGGKEATHGSAG
jgi:hypothetical protein